MKTQEMRNLDGGSLREELAQKRQELLTLRCQVALGEEMRPHQIKTIRKDIARILTVLRERERAKAQGVEA